MKNLKRIMSKPMTWGGYTKLCIISVIFSVIYCIIAWCIYMSNVSTKLRDLSSSKNDSLDLQTEDIDI